MTQPSGMMS